MRGLILLILLLAWILSAAGVFFLLSPGRGEIVGLSLSLCYFLFIYVFLDKWVLLLLRAVPANRKDSNLEKFKNLAYRHNVEKVDFYYSKNSFNNVIAFEWAGRKVVIFDKIFKESSETENSLNIVLDLFDSGEVRRRKLTMFVYSVYNLPSIFLEGVFGGFKLYELLSIIWYTPFRILSLSFQKNKHAQNYGINFNEGETSTDTFTSLMIEIISVYRTTTNDLVSLALNRDDK